MSYTESMKYLQVGSLRSKYNVLICMFLFMTFTTPSVDADDVCMPCEENYYCTGTSMTECPDNSLSPSGSTLVTQCRCAAGYYGVSDQGCNECPIGHYCEGGSSSSDLEIGVEHIGFVGVILIISWRLDSHWVISA